MLLEILLAKFPDAPKDLVEQIKAETDLTTLITWGRQIVHASSLDDLHEVLRNGTR